MSEKTVKKLARQNTAMFVAIVRQIKPVQQRNTKERMSKSVCYNISAKGRTEGAKTQEMKMKSPEKHFKSVQEREQENIQSVDPTYHQTLHEIFQKYRDVFPETLPKGRPQKGKLNMKPKLLKAQNPKAGHHIGSGLLSRMSWRSK